MLMRTTCLCDSHSHFHSIGRPEWLVCMLQDARACCSQRWLLVKVLCSLPVTGTPLQVNNATLVRCRLINASPHTCCDCLQRLARSSTFGEYSHILSDVSKWSRSVSSLDEAQLDAMRKSNGRSGKASQPRRDANNNRATFGSRSDM